MVKTAIKETIHAKGIDIGIYTTDFENEYISLTDIAKYNHILTPSNSRGLETKQVPMHLLCLQKNGLMPRRQLGSFLNQGVMVEHLHILILRLNLLHGFHRNLSYTLLKIING